MHGVVGATLNCLLLVLYPLLHCAEAPVELAILAGFSTPPNEADLSDRAGLFLKVDAK